MAENQSPEVKLGSLSHIGIVVRDMDEAIQYYSSVFGIGPFNTEIYDLNEFIHRGKPVNAKVKAGIANAGPVFIELIEVLEGETPHSEFLREKGEGVQHIAFTVDDIDDTLTKLAQDGIEPIMRYSLTIDGANDKQFEVHEAYLDSDKIGGTTIQLMEIKKK